MSDIQPTEPMRSDDSDTFTLSTSDIESLLGSKRKNFRAASPESYVKLFECFRTRVLTCFKALDSCRATDMYVTYEARNSIMVRRCVRSVGKGVLVRIEKDQRDPEMWFLSDELLTCERVTRNKLALEAGHLSFQYQGLIKSAFSCKCSIERLHVLEDDTHIEGIWCQQLSDNIAARIKELESSVASYQKKASELTDSLSIYFVPQPDTWKTDSSETVASRDVFGDE